MLIFKRVTFALISALPTPLITTYIIKLFALRHPTLGIFGDSISKCYSSGLFLGTLGFLDSPPYNYDVLWHLNLILFRFLKWTFRLATSSNIPLTTLTLRFLNDSYMGITYTYTYSHD